MADRMASRPRAIWDRTMWLVLLNDKVTRMAQASLYRYCQPADDIIDSKGPYDCSEHPHRSKQRSEACRRWPKEKVRFVWIISPIHIWGEGASSPVRQRQWSSSNWLGPQSESTWPIRMASKHNRMYMHACGLEHPLGLACAALLVRSAGWQSWKLILKAYFDFLWNLAPPKITRHTV